MPADYRLSIVKEIFQDLKAAYSSDILVQEDIVGNFHTVLARKPIHGALAPENFWISLGSEQGYGTRL